MLQRPVSPTFRSNELFYGDRDLKETLSQTRANMPQEANKLAKAHSQIEVYPRGHGRRVDKTMTGILGELNTDRYPQQKPKENVEEVRRKREVQSLSAFNKTMHS